MEYPTCLLYFLVLLILSPNASCVYRENTSDSWDIYRLTYSASELSGFTSCKSSLTVNSKFSIPHEAASCGIENFEFIVSERVQVNPDNSRAMSALTFSLFTLNTLQTKIVAETLSQPKPRCNDSEVLNLHHAYYTTIMTSRKLFSHNPVSRGTNQPIRKWEFVQLMKFE